MKNRSAGGRSVAIRSAALLTTLGLVGGGMAVWKMVDAQHAEAALASAPEPAEVVTAATAVARDHRESTTSIGTILATRSVTLRNELPGTVRQVRLRPGEVVEAGALLVELDTSVEAAELRALQARAELAEATLARVERLYERRAESAIDRDNARAERDVALADIERIRAIIERKTIRAPFRARVGIADVHPGQFLDAGSRLTTLQGVDDAAHVDFAVAQAVAAGLAVGDEVQVLSGGEDASGIPAQIVAVDARVDPTTRNAIVRARLQGGSLPSPGASVRVLVPVGESRSAVAIPVSALRRSPAGAHVFVLEAAEDGSTRSYQREVEAGPMLSADVVILSGLKAGDRVAALGSFKLREGGLVQLADQSTAELAGRE